MRSYSGAEIGEGLEEFFHAFGGGVEVMMGVTMVRKDEGALTVHVSAIAQDIVHLLGGDEGLTQVFKYRRRKDKGERIWQERQRMGITDHVYMRGQRNIHTDDVRNTQCDIPRAEFQHDCVRRQRL